MKKLVTLAIASSCAFSIMTSCANNTEASNTLSASVEENTSAITSEAPEIQEKVEKQLKETKTVAEEKAAVVKENVEVKAAAIKENVEAKVVSAKEEVKKITSANASPQIAFTETKVNFGTIEQGESFEHDFKFTNTGDAPLLITAAKGSCGCTVPEWPKEQIAPGDEGNIHVKFNSRGKRGNQHKTVTLTTNAEPSQIVLHLNGVVNVPGQE